MPHISQPHLLWSWRLLAMCIANTLLHRQLHLHHALLIAIFVGVTSPVSLSLGCATHLSLPGSTLSVCVAHSTVCDSQWCAWGLPARDRGWNRGADPRSSGETEASTSCSEVRPETSITGGETEARRWDASGHPQDRDAETESTIYYETLSKT